MFVVEQYHYPRYCSNHVDINQSIINNCDNINAAGRIPIDLNFVGVSGGSKTDVNASKRNETNFDAPGGSGTKFDAPGGNETNFNYPDRRGININLPYDNTYTYMSGIDRHRSRSPPQ